MKRGSEVEDGDVKQVAEAFRLIQVVYVVVIAGWGGQTQERREHWRQTAGRTDKTVGSKLVLFSTFSDEQTHPLMTSSPPIDLHL